MGRAALILKGGERNGSKGRRKEMGGEGHAPRNKTKRDTFLIMS